MKKYLALILTTFTLVGCNSQSGSGNTGDQGVSAKEIGVLDILADVESGEGLYNGSKVLVAGTLSYNYPALVSPGFCLTFEEMSALSDEDFSLVNVYTAETTNGGGTSLPEFSDDGTELRITNIPTVDYSFSCSGSQEVELSGILSYDNVYGYCDLIMYPSANLSLDTKSLNLLTSLLNCED